MSAAPALLQLRDELRSELEQGILPYWTRHVVDPAEADFVGFVSGDDVPAPSAPRGAILGTRILWTFSAAYRVLGCECRRAVADRLAEWVRGRLLDPVHGGAYWLLDAGASPLDDRKHIYAQAFAIYGLTEHHRATGDERSLRAAEGLYLLVERHAPDRRQGGYVEAFARDWTPLADPRLAPNDPAHPRSMNTHLHLLEAYTALYRVWRDAGLGERLRALIELFLDRIVDPASHHLVAFFDEQWRPRTTLLTYGHDIEASWLLGEAAEVLGDAELSARVRGTAERMSEAVLQSGYDPAGGLFEKGDAGVVTDFDKEWWPQAEAIIGFLNAWQITGGERFLRAALDTWAFVKRFVVDAEGGEWRRRVARDGTPRGGHEKVGPWKCPYHNSRACLEVIERVERLGS